MRAAILAVGAVLVAGAARAAEAPHVVATSPADGAKIAPSTASLSVTYDQPMSRSWSFVLNRSLPDPGLGQPTLSDDRRTITVPARLKPGTSYVLWLNNARFTNFRGVDGVPATPYRLTFSTTN